VEFVGEIKHPQLATYLKACDIFIRPSRSEGMGNSFVEAMAARLPVVATREGGISDFIFEGETAFVCEKDNPDSIVKAVEKIEEYKRDGKLQKVLDTASVMVKEKYDWDYVADRMDKEVFGKI
jgi:glycosyltransferase involved in cell wall biosynthesis